MISIIRLFENILTATFQNKKFKLKKKNLPGTPTNMFGKSFRRIEKMNNELKTLINSRPRGD